MRLEDNKIVVVDEDGNEDIIDIEILFTYHHDERNKDYVVFIEEGDEENAIAMIINEDNSLEEIVDDEEFDEILEVYDAFFDDEETSEEN
ncbi:MAG: DUF1292 domain-containing protein [Bacilli bacterium]|nr:DUF1292 domain-containing protein [Bacilli bacterium]